MKNRTLTAMAAAMVVAPLALASSAWAQSAYPSNNYPSSNYPSNTYQTPVPHSGTMQPGYGGTGSMNSGSNSGPNYGSTGGATMDTRSMGSGAMSGGRQVLMDIDDMQATSRADKGQNRLELMQTTLLNHFSSLGFTQVRGFQKSGNAYTTQAQTRDGQWVTVELDPRDGTISALR